MISLSYEYSNLPNDAIFHHYNLQLSFIKANDSSFKCFSLRLEMKPLGFICVLFTFLKTACGSSYSDLDQSDLEALRDLWFNSIERKPNESLSKQSDEFKQLIDVLSMMNPTEKRSSLFRDMKNVMLRNAREKTFGIFTNFCGPGNVDGGTVCGMFNGVDECCKAHDTCENYIGENKSERSMKSNVLKCLKDL
jgi:hypothetical protein